jgi:hypothetical protein
MAEDPYVYPGTGVLRNYLEIHDSRELSQTEADVVGLALRALADEPLPGGYDLAHWQAFHPAASRQSATEPRSVRKHKSKKEEVGLVTEACQVRADCARS